MPAQTKDHSVADKSGPPSESLDSSSQCSSPVKTSRKSTRQILSWSSHCGKESIVSSRQGSSCTQVAYNSARRALKRGESLSSIKKLVARDPKVMEERNEDGWTLLHFACYYVDKNSQAERVISFLAQFSPAALSKRTIKGEKATPFHLACFQGADLKVIKILIQEAPECVNLLDENGRSPLYYASCGRDPKAEVVDYLIEKWPLACLLTDAKGCSTLCRVGQMVKNSREGRCFSRPLVAVQKLLATATASAASALVDSVRSVDLAAGKQSKLPATVRAHVASRVPFVIAAKPTERTQWLCKTEEGQEVVKALMNHQDLQELLKAKGNASVQRLEQIATRYRILYQVSGASLAAPKLEQGAIHSLMWDERTRLPLPTQAKPSREGALAA